MRMGWRWERPRLHSDEEQRQERVAGWPEIVYDLAFVFAFSTLAVGLEGEIAGADVARFLLVLTPIWWVWMGVAFAYDRFTGSELGQWLITLLNLLAASVLALTAAEGTGARATGFILAYVAARALVIAQWLAAGLLDPAARPLTTRLAAGSALALAPWLLSLSVPAPARYGLWLLGLAIDLLTPLTTLPIQTRLPRLNAGHLAERYRLFTIIVLGEAVAGTIRGAGESAQLPLWSGTLALTPVFSVGWTAFEGPLRTAVPPGARGTASGYLLLPLVAALTAVGAALTDLVSHSELTPIDTARWLLCGATTVALGTIGLLELLQAPQQGGRPAVRLLAAAMVVAIGLFGQRLDTAALLAILVVVVLGQTVLGVVDFAPSTPM